MSRDLLLLPVVSKHARGNLPNHDITTERRSVNFPFGSDDDEDSISDSDSRSISDSDSRNKKVSANVNAKPRKVAKKRTAKAKTGISSNISHTDSDSGDEEASLKRPKRNVRKAKANTGISSNISHTDSDSGDEEASLKRPKSNVQKAKATTGISSNISHTDSDSGDEKALQRPKHTEKGGLNANDPQLPINSHKQAKKDEAKKSRERDTQDEAKKSRERATQDEAKKSRERATPSGDKDGNVQQVQQGERIEHAAEDLASTADFLLRIQNQCQTGGQNGTAASGNAQTEAQQSSTSQHQEAKESAGEESIHAESQKKRRRLRVAIEDPDDSAETPCNTNPASVQDENEKDVPRAPNAGIPPAQEQGGEKNALLDPLSALIQDLEKGELNRKWYSLGIECNGFTKTSQRKACSYRQAEKQMGDKNTPAWDVVLALAQFAQQQKEKVGNFRVWLHPAGHAMRSCSVGVTFFMFKKDVLYRVQVVVGQHLKKEDKCKLLCTMVEVITCYEDGKLPHVRGEEVLFGWDQKPPEIDAHNFLGNYSSWVWAMGSDKGARTGSLNDFMESVGMIHEQIMQEARKEKEIKRFEVDFNFETPVGPFGPSGFGCKDKKNEFLQGFGNQEGQKTDRQIMAIPFQIELGKMLVMPGEGVKLLDGGLQVRASKIKVVFTLSQLEETTEGKWDQIDSTVSLSSRNESLQYHVEIEVCVTEGVFEEYPASKSGENDADSSIPKQANKRKPGKKRNLSPMPQRTVTTKELKRIIRGLHSTEKLDVIMEASRGVRRRHSLFALEAIAMRMVQNPVCPRPVRTAINSFLRKIENLYNKRA